MLSWLWMNKLIQVFWCWQLWVNLTIMIINSDISIKSPIKSVKISRWVLLLYEKLSIQKLSFGLSFCLTWPLLRKVIHHRLTLCKRDRLFQNIFESRLKLTNWQKPCLTWVCREYLVWCISKGWWNALSKKEFTDSPFFSWSHRMNISFHFFWVSVSSMFLNVKESLLLKDDLLLLPLKSCCCPKDLGVTLRNNESY